MSTQEYFAPSAEFAAQANLKTPDLEALQQGFMMDSSATWAQLARKELSWSQDFTQTLNDSKAPFYKWFPDGELNISYNCIDRHLETQANKTAIIFEGEPGDTRKLSYRELHQEVCKSAQQLVKLSVKQGDRVCIYMPLCPEALIAMHACTRIGAIHSVVFAGFSAQALRDRIEDAQAKIIITADGLYRKGSVIKLYDTVTQACQGLSCVEGIILHKRLLDKDREIASTKPHNDTNNNDNGHCKQSEAIPIHQWQEGITEANIPATPLKGSDASFILYTSGSTGKPKGIQHGTAGYLLWTHLTCKWVFDLKPEDIYWCTADVGWITGHSYVAYGPLSNGATIFIYEGAPNHPHQGRFWELIDKYQISIFYTAPTAIRAFMQWGLEHVHKYKLDSLRLLGSVGEPIAPEAWLWFYKHIGQERCPLVDTWWQTETGGIMITTLPGIHSSSPGYAGKPLPGIDAQINEEGLLNIPSPWPSMLQTVYGDEQRYLDTYWSHNQVPDKVMASTTKQSRLTRQQSSLTMTTQTYTAGDGALKNDNGDIKITGRIDDVINVSGHRLGTAELEAALITHPSVTEAAVVSIPHEIKGEGIIAYVVGTDTEEAELKEHITKEIGAIARPERIISCTGLPKTRSGKIMRRLLKDLAQGKEPSGDLSTIENQDALEELKIRTKQEQLQ